MSNEPVVDELSKLGIAAKQTDAGVEVEVLNDDAEYAAYAQHCAIQKKVPLTVRAWRSCRE